MVRLKTLVTHYSEAASDSREAHPTGSIFYLLFSSAFRVEAMSKHPKQTAITQPLMHDDLREDYRASSIQAVGIPISLPPIRTYANLCRRSHNLIREYRIQNQSL